MISTDRCSSTAPEITSRISSVEAPRGLSRLRNALISRLASKTALSIPAAVPPGAANGLYLFVYQLLDLFGRHLRLSRPHPHLIDKLHDSCARLPAGVIAPSGKGHAVLEHMGIKLLAFAQVELLPNFVREGNGELAVADMSFGHGLSLHRNRYRLKEAP